MKPILVLFMCMIAGTSAFAAGGMECINDDPPAPMCTQPQPTQSMGLGFGSSSSLQVTTNIATGNLRTSFALGGYFPLAKPLVIYHNSRDNRTYPMGVGWNHSYNIMLLEHPDEWPETSVRIVLGTGGRIGFDLNLDGTYRGEPGVFSTLIKLADGSYKLYTNDSPNLVDEGNVCYEFGPADSTGRARLRYINYGYGSISLLYATYGYGAGELFRIRDNTTGHEVMFQYNYLGKLSSITSINGVTTYFTYNTSGDLMYAQSSWGTLTFDINADHNIETVTDGSGGHSAGFSYVDVSRVSSIRKTDGVFTDFYYTLNGYGAVIATSYGIRGQAPTTCEITENHLIGSITSPEGGKTCYTYSPDKCTTGSTQCSLKNGIRIADLD